VAPGSTVERLQTGHKGRVGLSLGLRNRDAGFQAAKDMQPHHLVGRRLLQPVGAGQHATLQSQRQPHIGLLAAGLADEACWCDANDGNGRVTDDQRLPNDIATAAETPLPIGVTDDRVRRFAGILDGCRKQPPDRWMDAEHFEKSPRDEATIRFLRRPTVDTNLPAVQTALRCHQRGESSVVMAQLLELCVAEPLSWAVVASAQHAGRLRVRKYDQFVWSVDASQRREQHAMPQTENGRVNADAQCERRDGNAGEHGTTANLT
jgi:hypothetical protein